MLSSFNHIMLLIVEMTLYSIDWCSDCLVWVKHDSHLSAHGSWWQVVSKASPHSACITMWTHHLAPLYSVPGVIDGSLNFLNVANFLSCVKLGTRSIFTVLNVNQGLTHGLSNSVSSESGEDALLVQSNWLGLVILLCLFFIDWGH